MKLKTRITSVLSGIIMLISMLSVFVFPATVASAESYAGDQLGVSTGLTDTSSFTAFSTTGAQNIIDLHYAELTAQNKVYRLATVEEAKAAAEGTKFTPTAYFQNYYQKPFTGYRWKMAEGNYKIESVADMNLLAELSNCGVNFSGVTFYQAADLDFGWEPFRGICVGHSMIGRIYHEGGTEEINGVSTTVYTEAVRSATTIRPFNGTFDGNGFIIEKFHLVANDAPYVGLIGWTYGAAVIKNVGIASGLIAGQECVGAIAGETNTTKIYNCWSAATVWGNGINGVGGLVGRLTGPGCVLQNSYNLGMVFSYAPRAAGLAGWQNNGAIANSYNWGQVIHDIDGKNTKTHSAIARKASENGPWQNSKAYFRNGCIDTGTCWADANKINSAHKTDNAVGVDATAANVAMLCGSSYLNSGISSANASGWTVKFQDLDVGYPVLTYTKNGKTISRVARTDVIGENHWGAMENSDLMKLIYEINKENKGTLGRLNHVEIHSANDLFVLGLLTTFAATNIKSVSLEADINMDTEFTLAPGLKTYVPLYSGRDQSQSFANSIYACTPDVGLNDSGVSGGNDHIKTSEGYGLYCAGDFNVVASMNITFDGKYHEVSNWNAYEMGRFCNRGGAFISQTSKGAVIKNLGLINVGMRYNATNMVNRMITYKLNYDPATKTYTTADNGTYSVSSHNYTYASLLVGLGYAPIIENCFTTGNITIVNNRANTSNNDSGILARTWDNGGSVQDCWTDCTITYPNQAPKRVRAIGSAYAEDTYSDVYLADTAWSGTPSTLPTGYLIYNNVYYIGDKDTGADYFDVRNPVRKMPFIHVDEASGSNGKKYNMDLAYFFNYQMKQKFMFTYNETDGMIHFAEPLKKNGENVINEDSGYTVFSNPTRKIIYALTSPEGDWICALSYDYVNAGTKNITLNTSSIPAVDGYTFNAGKSDLQSGGTMPYDKDPIIAYTAKDDLTAFEMLLTYYETLDGSGHMIVYEKAETHRYVYQMAKNIDGLTDATKRSARISEMLPVLLAYKKQASLEIKDEFFFPEYPYYLPYGISTDRGGNFKLIHTMNQYAITADGDWAALAKASEEGNNFEGLTFHFTNDIVDDPDNSFEIGILKSNFKGTVDGHGYTITCALEETVSTERNVALFVNINGSGVVKNLGVKGSVTVTVQSGANSNRGIAALAGNIDGNAKVIGCWNEATVTVTDATVSATNTKGTYFNYSIAGLVARCYGSIYDCYNIGDVTGLGRASGISDWVNDGEKANVHNVFNSGTITTRVADTETERRVVYSNAGTFSNIYAVEGTVSKLGGATALTDSAFVTEAAYSSGELAYTLNTKETFSPSTKVYFTISEDNKTVLGTAETQVRKIIVKNSDGTVTSTLYGAQGSEFSVSSGVYQTNKNHYTNGSFIVPDYDLTLTAATQASLAQYISLYTYWNGKRAAYFAVEDNTDLTSAEFESQIRALESAYSNGLVSITDMAALEIGAFTTLQGKYKSGDAGMPHAFLLQYHADAPVGYRIHSAEDMRTIAEYTEIVSAQRPNGSETLLKMANDVDMALYSGEQFYINALDATVDGNNKTIYNFTCENVDKDNADIGPALFRDYRGSGIYDLTIDNLLVSGGYAVGGLLGWNYGKYVNLNNITIRNSRVRKAFVTGNSDVAMGMLVGRIWDNGGTSLIKDCVIENCYLDVTLFEQGQGGAPMINMGFVAGQLYETLVIDGVVCRNNVILVNGHEKDKISSVGYLVGEPYLESSEKLTIRNTAVYGNNTITDPLVTADNNMLYGLAANTQQSLYKYGELVGWFKTHGTLRISNVQVAGNDAKATNSRTPLLAAVSQDSTCEAVTFESELIYWDKNSDPASQVWYIDPSGTRLTATNAKVHNYETTDFFKYGRSGWEANNDIINSVNTLEADADLRKWTVVHSDTYRDTKDLEDLPYPTLVKSGEEPIHRLYFQNVVGSLNVDKSRDEERYSDSAKMLIATIDEMDNPEKGINKVPWKGCTGNMKNYVHPNLNGDVTIPSVVANYPYMSLSLDTTIAVNFFVHIHPDFRNDQYQLTTTHSQSYKDAFDITIKGDLKAGQSVKVLHKEDGHEYHQIRLPLNANEMWRSFRVTVTDKGNTEYATYTVRENQTQISGQHYTDHSNAGYIKEYVRAILNSAEGVNPEYDKAKDLVAAMLNYGNEVRDCFWLGGDDRPWIDELKTYGYPLYSYTDMKDNDFTDKKVTDDEAAAYKATLTPYKSKGSKKNDPLTYVGSSLVFDTNVAIRHYLKLDQTASQEGVAALNAAYDASVRKSDGTLIKDLEYKYSAEQKMYYVEYADIAAQDMDELFLFTFSKGTYDANSNYVVKLNYGVFSYAHMTWNKLMEEKFVTAALYEYWKQAEAYLEATA